MKCPFSVGQRIHELGPTVTAAGEVVILEGPDPSRPDATVTAVDESGFTYVYDTPVPFGRAADGLTIYGGTCFPEGYQYWVPAEEPRSQS